MTDDTPTTEDTLESFAATAVIAAISAGAAVGWWTLMEEARRKVKDAEKERG